MAVDEAADQAAQRAESHVLTPGGLPSGASPLGRPLPLAECSHGQHSSHTLSHGRRPTPTTHLNASHLPQPSFQVTVTFCRARG